MSLQRLKQPLDAAFKNLHGINAERERPLFLGIGLVRFKLSAPVEDGLVSETAKQESRALQERIEESLRSRDQIIEIDLSTFAIILRGIESDEHLELAGAKLQKLLRAPVSVLNQDYPIRYCGALIRNERGDNPVSAIQRVVESLKHASRSGQSIRVGNRADHAGSEADANLESDLEQAIACGEFVPYFQPKVSAAFQTIIGVETLTRWHSKTRGVVAPADFMATLERSGHVEAFTHRLLRTVFSHAQGWSEDLSISINVPASLVANGRLALAVKDALELFSVEPKRLVLEVTESLFVEDAKAVALQLRALQRLGVAISIDDFGTGYSSLAYLRDLPADEIKLDKAFLEDFEKAPQAQALVSGIIQLAHALKLRVVAEGVERRKTAELLKTMNCDLLQGYLFGKPLPPEEFERWLGVQMGAA
ncbi:MAG: EAL domain-containing protein [Pseudomonadota bacterium]